MYAPMPPPMPRWPPLPPYQAYPIQRSFDRNYAPMPPKRMPLQRIYDGRFNRPWNAIESQAVDAKHPEPRPFPVFIQRKYYQHQYSTTAPQHSRKSDATTTRRPKAEQGLAKDKRHVNKESVSENVSVFVRKDAVNPAILSGKSKPSNKEDASRSHTGKHSIWSTTPQELKTMMQKAKRASKSAKRMELQKMKLQRGLSWPHTERSPTLECHASDDSTGDESSDQEEEDTEELPLRKYYSLIHMDSPIPLFSGVVSDGKLTRKAVGGSENSVSTPAMQTDTVNVLDYRKLFAMSAKTPCFFPKAPARGISKDEDPPLVNLLSIPFLSTEPDFNWIDFTTLPLFSRSKTRRRKLLPTWTGGR